MAQFPLALSIEPRLLPPAVANGFHMDDKVRIYSCFQTLGRLSEHASSIETSSSAKCSRRMLMARIGWKTSYTMSDSFVFWIHRAKGSFFSCEPYSHVFVTLQHVRQSDGGGGSLHGGAE